MLQLQGFRPFLQSNADPFSCLLFLSAGAGVPPTVAELAQMLLDRADLPEQYRRAIAALLEQADADT
jgi:hypothetical protein